MEEEEKRRREGVKFGWSVEVREGEKVCRCRWHVLTKWTDLLTTGDPKDCEGEGWGGCNEPRVAHTAITEVHCTKY